MTAPPDSNSTATSPVNTVNTTTTGTSKESEAESAIVVGISEDWLAVLIGGILIVITLVIAIFAKDFKFSVPAYQWANIQDLTSKVLSFQNLLLIFIIGVILFLLSAVAIKLQGGNVLKLSLGFVFVYVLGIVSLIIAGNKTIDSYGLEYVIFALVIGLLIGNLTKVPVWLQEASRSEFYIKTGLVILGTSVLFTDIVQAGIAGILQSLIVVFVVWFFALWFSRLLKVDDEFGVMLASAVSICGVSAAIAACGAIKGDKKKLSYVTTIVLIVAIPMLVLQPWMIKTFSIPEIVGGAWLGGTLDTTASVTAAAQLVGPVALKAGVIVKFSQNVLIGIAAFLLAIWWTFRKKPGKETSNRPGVGIVWERFPKFVFGFIIASLIFSFLIPSDTIKQVSGILNGLRTTWFSLAFISIGLEARFADLIKLNGGRPALAFVVAQVFNIIWTLLWAYLLFSGSLFPGPDIK